MLFAASVFERLSLLITAAATLFRYAAAAASPCLSFRFDYHRFTPLLPARDDTRRANTPRQYAYDALRVQIKAYAAYVATQRAPAVPRCTARCYSRQ